MLRIASALFALALLGARGGSTAAEIRTYPAAGRRWPARRRSGR